LRQKIESNPDCPVFLRTVHGVGYKFVPQKKTAPLGAKSALRARRPEETWAQ
jgi:hypothetical protein